MDRSSYIGGSDAKRILEGDWLSLYQEKMGLRPEEDLSRNFQVQLGVFTEPFHLGWLNKYEGFDIHPIQQQRSRVAGDEFMAANLDGWCSAHNTFIDTKHSNIRASRESMVEWYQPQIAHYCNVVDRTYGYVSYIAGNAEPDYFRMEPSEEYRLVLRELERAFWWHIENRTAPEGVPPSLAGVALKGKDEAANVKIDAMRTVDMSMNNQWAVLATDYQLNIDAAATFEKAKKGLKEMVEKDVRQASGHGVVIKRSKNGSLRFGEE